MIKVVELSNIVDEQEADQLRSLLNVNRNSGAISHLNKLHKFRNSGVLLEAAKDWLDSEIAELTHDIVRREAFGI